jgi:hypothetical protein
VPPKPEDFDPDPAARRRRIPPPAYVRADPWSIPNILKSFAAAGFKARVTRLGGPPWNKGHIHIDLPQNGRGRFIAIGERSRTHRMEWRLVWDGNGSKAGLKRYLRTVSAS